MYSITDTHLTLLQVYINHQVPSHNKEHKFIFLLNQQSGHLSIYLIDSYCVSRLKS